MLPDATDLEVTGTERLEFGHSAEMLLLTISYGGATGPEERKVVVRLQPPSPGLLEPYDLARQFQILRALESTAVKAPRGLWLEATGDILGRPFYVMERLPGEVYERTVPAEFDDDPIRIRTMCEGIIDQLAAIHSVDLRSTGLDALGDGPSFIDRELKRWDGELTRVRRGPLPALERLSHELHSRRPPSSPVHTLVHGDMKPGNFAFVHDVVSAVFDWELADIGDPMADIGYLEVMWAYPVGLTSRPSAPTFEEALFRYEQKTGFEVRNRSWFSALEAYKTAVILLVGSMLFESGDTDDFRYLEMALGVAMTTDVGLRALDIFEEIPSGPVMPSDARIAEAQQRQATRPAEH